MRSPSPSGWPPLDEGFFSRMRCAPPGSDAGEVRLVCHAAALPAPVLCCGRVGSVLDVAHAHWAAVLDNHGPAEAQTVLPVWTSLLAATQTAGRGQLRRQWSSPAGNVYAALRLPCPAAHEPDAALWRGTAAAPLLGALLVRTFVAAGFAVGLKWPNDLVTTPAAASDTLPGPRKLGGILLEERRGALWAGIGLNVRHAPPPALLRGEHALEAACLADRFPEQMQALSRQAAKCACPGAIAPPADGLCLALWCWLVSGLAFCYREEVRASTAPWQDWAGERLLWRGRRVRLTQADVSAGAEGGDVVGVLLGLGAHGGALLARDGRVEECFGGSLQPWGPP